MPRNEPKRNVLREWSKIRSSATSRTSSVASCAILLSGIVTPAIVSVTMDPAFRLSRRVYCVKRHPGERTFILMFANSNRSRPEPLSVNCSLTKQCATPNWDRALLQSVDFTQRSEEHTSELQSRFDLVCRLLLE